jgi:hypothetical protein
MAKKKISKKQQLAEARKKLELQRAREFVKDKFKDINAKKVDYKKLSTLEKRVYNALEQKQNRFTYKTYYDLLKYSPLHISNCFCFPFLYYSKILNNTYFTLVTTKTLL